MLALLLSLPGLAAPPPALTLAALEDPAPWEARARALLDGPPGCIDVQGRVRLQVSLYTPGGWISRGERSDVVGLGRFSGTLDQGVWTQLQTTWDDAATPAAGGIRVDRIHPIVGRLPALSDGQKGKEEDGDLSIEMGEGGLRINVSDSGEAALGVLDEALESIDPGVTTAYVVWDDATGAVRLHQLVALGDREDLEVTVLFPNDGPPTRLDAVFPSVLKRREGGFTFTARDAQLHLRGKVTDVGLVPAVEGVSVVMGALGFTLGFDQRLSYDRVRACRAASPAVAPAASPAVAPAASPAVAPAAAPAAAPTPAG